MFDYGLKTVALSVAASYPSMKLLRYIFWSSVMTVKAANDREKAMEKPRKTSGKLPWLVTCIELLVYRDVLGLIIGKIWKTT